MKLLLKYTMAGSLIPIDEMSATDLSKLKPGDIVTCEVKKPRNVKFHRKFFAMLGCAYEHRREGLLYPDTDDFRKDVMCAAGFYNVKHGISGKDMRVAKSMSFAKMDEVEFEELYNRCIDVVILHVLPVGTDKGEFEQAVSELLGF